MKKNRPVIDGFIPRRSGAQLGSSHQPETADDIESRPVLHTGSDRSRPLGKVDGRTELGRLDISESLDEIEDAPQPEDTGKRRRRHRRKLKPLTPGSVKRRRIVKWTLIGLVVLILGFGAYFVTKIFLAQGGIFEGSIFDIVQNEPLKQDANGRSNFLVVGTSEDDPGHPGAYLTDSMMVVSIDQNRKNVYMFSVPRDLYVEYGMACNSGYYGKINEYFLCSNGDLKSDAAEQDRLTKTQKFVGDIFGLDIQYGVHVNNTVIKDAVDAVGGIDITIESSDPRGIYDSNFDWRCNYTCYLVKYPNGKHHLDGEHALYLAMARGSVAPTYGLASNFDREKNQQKIIVALKEKAVNTGTLMDVGKVTGLIDALGKNLRTNIQVKEIRTLMNLGTEIPSDSIKTISLFDDEDRVVTTGNYNGASVVMPVAGMFNYGQIRQYIDDNLSSDPVVQEKAGIVVLNGTKTSGLAQTEADKLSAKKYEVVSVGNAPSGNYAHRELYVVDASKTGTLEALKSLYPDIVVKTDVKPPVAAGEGTAFVLVVGPAS